MYKHLKQNLFFHIRLIYLSFHTSLQRIPVCKQHLLYICCYTYSMQSVIEVKELTKQFNSLTAVDHLSFSVQEGDVYGFLGQNGAGKSTTIRMLLTLVQPTGGSIELFGLNLQSHRHEILKQVGAMIEKPDVYKYLSGYDNLKLFAKLSGIKPTNDLLMQHLDKVGLADRAKDKVKTYSQGMKQRLGIAISLVHDPKLIILDEPTNGLDPQGIADIRNLILHLRKEREKTLLISSHLLGEIEQVATKVLIIDKGKKLVAGSAAELFDPSQTVVHLQTTNNPYALQVLEQSKWKPLLQAKSEEDIILKMDRKNIPLLSRDLVSMNIDIVSLQPRNSLEDYFLQITTGSQHVEAFTN